MSNIKIFIKFQNILDRGEKRYKVLDFDMLTESELPHKYVNGRLYIYKIEHFTDESPRICYSEDGTKYFVAIDNYLTQTEFNRLMRVAEAAGKRLSKINKDIDTLKDFWEWKVNTATF